MAKRKREGNHQAASKAALSNGVNGKVTKTNGHVDVKTSVPVKSILKKPANGIEQASTIKKSNVKNSKPPRKTATTINGTETQQGRTNNDVLPESKVDASEATTDASTTSAPSTPLTIQIITGSYEAVLHGISATLTPSASSNTTPTTSTSSSTPTVTFSDTFLFNAHTSSIRCLALSALPDPDAPTPQGIYLATGSSDERINVYSLAASPLPQNDRLPRLPSLSLTTLSENPANRELGNVVQHSAPVTSLHFPSRSKLLSASEDNTIAVTRVRDLEVVSTIKAPRPKVQGQPSGDTAPPGATPMAVNDFAVHPSMKLMLTVGKGERCMRLWNLVTGKKAGVLNFERSLLEGIREGKYSSGEGRRTEWNAAGDGFAVGFERGVVLFGEDSRPRAKVGVWPTKICQMRYVDIGKKQCLALGTEDGRVIFYDVSADAEAESSENVPDAKFMGQIGGKAAGLQGRVKDFKVLSHPNQPSKLFIITASSDGSIRIWQLSSEELAVDPKAKSDAKTETVTQQIGTLLSSHETGNRITCLEAFIMQPPREEDEGGMSEFEGVSSAAEESSVSEDSD